MIFKRNLRNLLKIDEIYYVANLGDSRGIISKDLGTEINQASIDHRPWDESEKIRIISEDGSLYNSEFLFDSIQKSAIYRINPGGLAVSRTISDVESKLNDYGGKPNLVSAIPDIICFKITEDIDFLILARKRIFHFKFNS